MLTCINATAPLVTAGGEMSLGLTPSGSSTAGSGGGGREAFWFQSAAASASFSALKEDVAVCPVKVGIVQPDRCLA